MGAQATKGVAKKATGEKKPLVRPPAISACAYTHLLVTTDMVPSGSRARLVLQAGIIRVATDRPTLIQVGFFLFSKHHREEVKKGLPEGSAVTEVAKALGVMWKKLPEVRTPAQTHHHPLLQHTTSAPPPPPPHLR